jgi:hypothetical protein
MKREFGFTQARFVLSVCHANAKHPKSRPTEAPRSHSYYCHAERSEASEIPPNQNTATPPNLLPQCPRSASVRRAFRFFASLRMTRVRQGASDPAALQSGRAQGWFANRPCCAFAQNDRVGRMLVSLLCASCWSCQAYKLRTRVNERRGQIGRLLPSLHASSSTASPTLRCIGLQVASCADGEPGVKTIWLGFRCLADIAAAWQLMHSMLANPPSTYG